MRSSRSLALSTALMVVVALVVPLAGIAAAQQGQQPTEPFTVNLQPEADTAATGTCNTFTVTVTGANQRPVANRQVLVQLTQQTTQQNTIIGFCTPQPGPGQQTAGPNVQTPGAGGVGAATPAGANAQTCAAASGTQQAPATATCEATFTTDQNGQVTFGVTSNTPGTMQVMAQVTANQQGETGTQYRDFSNKTWVAGGQQAVTNLDCEPEAAQNLEGTSHTFTCTALTRNQTGTANVPVAGVTVNFDVVAGPNAEEVGNQPCAGTTNNNGQITCTYADNVTSGGGAAQTNAGSPLGTDTITAYVEQACPPNATQCNPAGVDPGEPQDQITKTWVGPARTINCDPNTATNPSGSTHTVTCTVTDVNGTPLQNVAVAFAENGPGRFVGNTTQLVTNAQGQVQIQTTTQANETGTQEITGTILYCSNNPGGFAGTGGGCAGGTFQTAQQAAGNQECEQAAGQSTVGGATTSTGTTGQNAAAGTCAETVLKNWGQAPTEPTTPTPPPTGWERQVTLETSRRIKQFGKQFSLAGTVTTPEPNAPTECIANIEVILERQIVGTDTFVEVDRTTTDAQGLFALTRTADRSALYVARVDATGTQPGSENPLCAESASNPDELLVKKAVRLRISDTNIRRGKRIRFTVSFAPCEGHRGHPVYLLKAIGGVMGKIASKKGAATQDCQASFKRRVFKTSVFQGMSPKRDPDHRVGKSRKKAVTVRRR